MNTIDEMHLDNEAVKISIATADLRAAFLREMHRLDARLVQGGPFTAIRDGALLAWLPGQPEVVVDEDTLDALRRLPDGAGVERVREALA